MFNDNSLSEVPVIGPLVELWMFFAVTIGVLLAIGLVVAGIGFALQSKRRADLQDDPADDGIDLQQQQRSLKRTRKYLDKD